MAVNVILTKDDLHEMIIAMDVIYNLMDDSKHRNSQDGRPQGDWHLLGRVFDL